ncbi:MAG: CvpA family protein [Pseudomonadota bacterium]
MSFTYVDAIVGVIVLLSAILAWNRGFTREIFAIGGWVLAAFAAFFFAPQLEPLIREVPVIGSFLARSCVLSMIAAFVVIMGGALLILAVFTPVFASAVLESSLGPVDRMLGFIFGAARGLLLLAVAFLIYTSFSGDAALPALDQAASKPIFDEMAALVDQYRPEELPGWFSERIDALMAPCEGGVPASDSAPSTDLN